MSNQRTPRLSPNFTVDDIHTLRKCNYEHRKSMSAQEQIADIKRGADAFLLKMYEAKRSKIKPAAQ